MFEYCESDLEQLIKDRRTLLSAADIKAYMHMILAALHFCHRNWVLHRDIKPNNFLITKQGALPRPSMYLLARQGFLCGVASSGWDAVWGVAFLGGSHGVSIIRFFRIEQMCVGERSARFLARLGCIQTRMQPDSVHS